MTKERTQAETKMSTQVFVLTVASGVVFLVSIDLPSLHGDLLAMFCCCFLLLMFLFCFSGGISTRRCYVNDIHAP